MRLVRILITLLLTLFSAPAFAENGTLIISPTTPRAPPSTDEYNNIPPGLLMSGDGSPVLEATDDAPVEEEAMTMEDLTAAYSKGQFELVAKHLIPIANGNYPQAEEMLGIMYRNGQGVPKDPEKAIAWLTKAAEAGRPLAQHHLAIISFTGDGATQDTVKAMMWLYIAIAHYNVGLDKTRAIQDRDNVATALSRRDKRRAFELAQEWMQKRNDTAVLEEAP